MKILIVDIEHMSFVGGRQTYSRTLMKYLVRLGHEITLISSRPSPELPWPEGDWCEYIRVDVDASATCADEFFDGFVEGAVARLPPSASFDTTIAHGVVDLAILRKAKFIGAVPATLIIHSPPPLEEKVWVNEAIADSDRVRLVVLSEYMRAWASGLGFERDSIFVVPGFYDSELFEARPMHERTERYFLCPARPERRKNILSVIAAFRLFMDEWAGENIHLRIGGFGGARELLIPHQMDEDDTSRSEVATASQDLIDTGLIRYLDGTSLTNSVGGVSLFDMSRIYASAVATLYVPGTFPFGEPFGLSVLESLAAETPVIASRSGGIPEISSVCGGILLSEVQPNELCAHMLRLARSDAARDSLARDGSRTVSRFRAERVVGEFVEVAINWS